MTHLAILPAGEAAEVAWKIATATCRAVRGGGSLGLSHATAEERRGTHQPVGGDALDEERCGWERALRSS